MCLLKQQLEAINVKHTRPDLHYRLVVLCLMIHLYSSSLSPHAFYPNKILLHFPSTIFSGLNAKWLKH